MVEGGKVQCTQGTKPKLPAWNQPRGFLTRLCTKGPNIFKNTQFLSNYNSHETFSTVVKASQIQKHVQIMFHFQGEVYCYTGEKNLEPPPPPPKKKKKMLFLASNVHIIFTGSAK